MRMVVSSFICPTCGRQTSHELHYAGPVLHEIRCLTCSRVNYATHHPIGSYVRELRSRIVSKPERIHAEMAEAPPRVLSLPKRIASKPVRMVRELIEIMR